jgi:hypothetical protein
MARMSRWALLALLAVVPAAAWAGPDDCGCNGKRDCPRSDYSILHYWWPELYRARAVVHPSYLDQYPPGPYQITPTFEIQRFRCPSIPATPTTPYADPAAYYGRPAR